MKYYKINGAYFDKDGNEHKPSLSILDSIAITQGWKKTSEDEMKEARQLLREVNQDCNNH